MAESVKSVNEKIEFDKVQLTRRDGVAGVLLRGKNITTGKPVRWWVSVRLLRSAGIYEVD